jgi:hypothetical protein
MHANKGDRIIVESVTVDSARRSGRILEVMGGPPVSTTGLGGMTATRASSFPARTPGSSSRQAERRTIPERSDERGQNGPSDALL